MRLLLVFTLAATGWAETYQFEPKEFYNTFSGAYKPALRIKPGDHVVTYTIDANGVDSHGVQRARGSSRALNEALQHATTELMRWLMTDYGFDERGASLLMGQGMEYDISNVVDPEFTIVAKMRKQYLGRRP